MEIRKISKADLQEAMDLVWQVFQEFEAPEYPQEGIDEFRNTIDRQLEHMTFAMYGAFEHNELAGVIATRKDGSHISLFFVKSTLHGRGIGKQLFQHIVPLAESTVITVNSSPYAVNIYRHLGFSETDTEQITSGIRYVPMEYIKRTENKAPAE